jgi:histidinol phosphatase-like PHP family hydrolase
VPITFGSDAHLPEHVGRDFALAAALAQAADYTEFAALEQSGPSQRATLQMRTFAG